MVGEFFRKLITRAKEVAKSLKAKFISLTKKFIPAVPVTKFLIPCISSEICIAMKISKRYRRTSDHSPIFSLFTFFSDSQTPVSGV